MANNDTFRLVISCDLTGDGTVYLELDTCTSKSVTANSTVATHPLADGSVMSDHMYRNPTNFNVSGKFSLNGRQTMANSDCFGADNLLRTPQKTRVANLKTYYSDTVSDGVRSKLALNSADESRYVSSALRASLVSESASTISGELKNLVSDDRLSTIQNVFEYIKNKGIICTLTTIRGDPANANGQRYKTRENMVLQSISWTESYNTMDYSFGFVEIMKGSLQLYNAGSYSDIYGETSSGSIRSLGEILLETAYNDDYITLQMLKTYADKTWIYDYDIYATSLLLKNCGDLTDFDDISDTFKNQIQVMGELFNKYGGVNKLPSAAGATWLAAVVVSGSVALLTGATAATGGLALVAAGIIWVCGFLEYAAFRALYNWSQSKYRKALVDNAKNYVKTSCVEKDKHNSWDSAIFKFTTYDKFQDVLDTVATKAEACLEDVHVYTISTSVDDNGRRVTPIVLNDSILYVAIEPKTSANDTDSGWMLNVYGSADCSSDSKLRRRGTSWNAVTSFDNCTQDNAFYLDTTQDPYTELYLLKMGLNGEYETDTEDLTDEQVTNKELYQYNIMVSFGCFETIMEEFANTIEDAIEDQWKK